MGYIGSKYDHNLTIRTQHLLQNNDTNLSNSDSHHPTHHCFLIISAKTLQLLQLSCSIRLTEMCNKGHTNRAWHWGGEGRGGEGRGGEGRGGEGQSYNTISCLRLVSLLRADKVLH